MGLAHYAYSALGPFVAYPSSQSMFAAMAHCPFVESAELLGMLFLSISSLSFTLSFPL